MGATFRKDAVFVNAPFSDDYSELFRAIIFALIACGRQPRCALEEEDGGEIRLVKIARLIADSGASIHDISYVQLDPKVNLPRFNMPFELGMVMGAKLVARGRAFSSRPILILENESYSFQKCLSDISGQDAKPHNGSPTAVLSIIRNWIRSADKTAKVPGDMQLKRYFQRFNEQLPDICKLAHTSADSISYFDLIGFMQAWLDDEASMVR